MKALTLLQPWASLMVTRWPSGRFCKMFETRSWYTNYRGPIAIHSSARITVKNAEIAIREPFCSALGLLGYHGVEKLPTGVVLGIGRLVDCIPAMVAWTHPQFTPDSWTSETAFGDYSPGRFAWLIEDMEPLETPIPAKGKLGLWQWEAPEERGLSYPGHSEEEVQIRRHTANTIRKLDEEWKALQ